MDTNSTQEHVPGLQGLSVDLQDRINRASYLMGTLMCMVGEDDLPAEVASLWKAAGALYSQYSLIEERYVAPVRVAHLLALNAVLAAPEALTAALQHLRADLVRLDPCAGYQLHPRR